MEYSTPFLAPVPQPETDVIVLPCADPLHLDPAVLNRLYAQHSEHEVEELVCRVLEDVASRLDQLQQGRAKSDFQAMQKPAGRIGLVASQIGLIEVAVSAGHVSNCLEQGDGIALEATLARLERAFDVAVSEVWNFRDL